MIRSSDELAASNDRTGDTQPTILPFCQSNQGGLDGSLAQILAAGIGLEVTVVEAREEGHPLVLKAKGAPHTVHTDELMDSPSVRQALALPAGGVP